MPNQENMQKPARPGEGLPLARNDSASTAALVFESSPPITTYRTHTMRHRRMQGHLVLAAIEYSARPVNPQPRLGP